MIDASTLAGPKSSTPVSTHTQGVDASPDGHKSLYESMRRWVRQMLEESEESSAARRLRYIRIDILPRKTHIRSTPLLTSMASQAS